MVIGVHTPEFAFERNVDNIRYRICISATRWRSTTTIKSRDVRRLGGGKFPALAAWFL